MSDEVKHALAEIEKLKNELVQERELVAKERRRLQKEREADKGDVIPQQVAARMKPRALQQLQAQGARFHMYDTRTKQVYDESVRVWMWRPGALDRCACGKVAWARTAEFVGEEAVQRAQRSVIDQESGVLHQEGWRFVYDEKGETTIPEELQRTEEKIEHAKECNEQHKREMLGELIDENKQAAMVKQHIA